MSLIEIENSIKVLTTQEKARLVMALLQELDNNIYDEDEFSYQNEIISRSNDEYSYFIDSELVINEAKTKYSV